MPPMSVLDWIWQFAVDQVKENQFTVFLMLLAFVRLFGTVIDSGWRGVLFRCGRVAKTLEPGFHYLIPLVHRVRKVRVRSVTINLPKQRVTTSDGLVFDVDANIVYHVGDPAKAAVQVDDVTTGCQNVVPLVIAGLVTGQTSASLSDREQVDRELHRRLERQLGHWGLVVENAGFQSIAPTAETLRLTQLRLRIAERERAWIRMIEGGLAAEVSLVLLASDQQLTGHGAARYHRLQRRPYRSHRGAPRIKAERDDFKVGDRVQVDYQKTGLFFDATITERTGSVVHVTYTDGEEETTTITSIRRPQTAETTTVPPAPATKPIPSKTVHRRPRRPHRRRPAGRAPVRRAS